MTIANDQSVLSEPNEIATLVEEVGKFLARWKTAALATVDDAGHPHAANIQYASELKEDGIELVYISNDASAHSRHIARDGQVALTVYAHVRRPDQIHGVQIHGRCEAVARDTPEWEAAWRLYSARYPFVKLPPLRQRVQAETFWRLRVTWVRFVDNRKGFGFKQECELGDGD